MCLLLTRHDFLVLVVLVPKRSAQEWILLFGSRFTELACHFVVILAAFDRHGIVFDAAATNATWPGATLCAASLVTAHLSAGSRVVTVWGTRYTGAAG